MMLGKIKGRLEAGIYCWLMYQGSTGHLFFLFLVRDI